MEVVAIYISIGVALLLQWANPEMSVYQIMIIFTTMSILFEVVVIADRIKKGEK